MFWFEHEFNVHLMKTKVSCEFVDIIENCSKRKHSDRFFVELVPHFYEFLLVEQTIEI